MIEFERIAVKSTVSEERFQDLLFHHTVNYDLETTQKDIPTSLQDLPLC